MASASLRRRWNRGGCAFALSIGVLVVTVCGCFTVELDFGATTSSTTNEETKSSVGRGGKLRSSYTTSSEWNSIADQNLMHLELRPTSSLIEERRRRRRQRQRQRRLLTGARGNTSNDTFLPDVSEGNETKTIPDDWFHPYLRAVYATLHPPRNNDDENDSENSTTLAEHHYRDFVKHRHLSRFERHFRESLGLNLHPHWTGNYSDPEDEFTEFHDPTVLIEEIFGDTTTTAVAAATTTTRTRLTAKASNQTHTVHPRQQAVPDSRKKRKLLESLVGGKFDQYQGVPLSQGYGTHYVHLWVGSPIPQRQSVIVDTGSHFTGFPVARECQNCGEAHHTDPHFDPARSETFRALRCPSECLENFECESASTTPSAGIASSQKKADSMSSDYFYNLFDNNNYNKNNNNRARCTFTQAYTEGSSWTAYQARDVVYCGGGGDMIEAVDPLDVKYSLEFVFGCLKANTGLFVTQLADGIMGMSAHELTLPKQLYNKRKIEYNMFALCFRKELGTSKKGVTAGSMTLGGVSSALDTSPMVYAKNIRPYGWYTVFLQNIFLATKGGTKFLFDDPNKSPPSILEENSIEPLAGFNPTKVNRDRGVIVDSGTTDTYLCSSVRKEFSSVWKKVTGMEYSNSAVYLTQAQLEKLPTVLIQLQASGTVHGVATPVHEYSDNATGTTGGTRYNKPVLGQVGYLDPDHMDDVLLAIPATSYMEYSPTLKVYTSRLFFTESRGGVIGANAIQGHNVLFDWQHGRIGFAQSSCSYDLIPGKNDNHGDFGGSGRGGSSIGETSSAETTCSFVDYGKLPILTQTCLQSVSSNPSSMAICMASDSPTNVDIEGLEIWTLRIQNPGNDPTSCEAPIAEWSESVDTQNQIDASQTSCTPDGLCQEYRPCHVPCLTAIEYHRYHLQKQSKRQQEHAGANSTKPPLDEAVTIPHTVFNRTTFVDHQQEDRFGVAENPCRDWIWTACDHSCHQSRISSKGIVTHANGRYCLESGREIRSCHIDACGRSDPCIVPFLVHAIFVLEGGQIDESEGDKEEDIESLSEPPAYWTPVVEEDFKRSLVLAAHHPNVFKKEESNRGKLLFGEGDIDILVARPWYSQQGEGSDLEVEENMGFENETLNHQIKNNTSRGLQLILQISISNPKAIPKHQQNQQEGGRGRMLLQEVGVVWSNLTSVFRRPKATSVCDPFDLYPLAKISNEVADEILTNPIFLSQLVTGDDDDRNENNIHRLIVGRGKKGLQGFHSARLVSSWTIGTQIYDDYVNYLGPLASTPFFPIIKFLYEAFFLILALWLCKFLICIFRSVRLCRVSGNRLRKKLYRNQEDRKRDEKAINNSKDDDFEMSPLLFKPSPVPTPNGDSGVSSEIELSATYLGSKATKRTNSTTTTLSLGVT